MPKFFSFALAFAVLLIAGCGGTRTIETPAAPPPPPYAEALGEWAYLAPGTPQGDIRGTVTILEGADGLEGSMTFDFLMDPVPLRNVVYADGTISFDNTVQAGPGQFIDTSTAMSITGDSAEGQIDVPGFGQFPIMADRVVEESAAE
ncbi:MAG: hypothetical protein AAF752_09380 [Bacteroidota bacterium]